MNGIRSVVKFLEGEVRLCKAGLHPAELPKLENQLLAARQESNRQFFEGLKADEKFYEAHRSKTKPPTCLVSRSCDEWMDSHGNWHWQNPEEGH